jgi:hypothetical protein
VRAIKVALDILLNLETTAKYVFVNQNKTLTVRCPLEIPGLEVLCQQTVIESPTSMPTKTLTGWDSDAFRHLLFPSLAQPFITPHVQALRTTAQCQTPLADRVPSGVEDRPTV